MDKVLSPSGAEYVVAGDCVPKASALGAKGTPHGPFAATNGPFVLRIISVTVHYFVSGVSCGSKTYAGSSIFR